MNEAQRRKPVPAWSTPERGTFASWLGAEARAGLAGFIGIAALGVVLVVSAAVRSPWPAVGVGALGTGALWADRASGRAVRHALWVASVFLLLLGLLAAGLAAVARR